MAWRLFGVALLTASVLLAGRVVLSAINSRSEVSVLLDSLFWLVSLLCAALGGVYYICMYPSITVWHDGLSISCGPFAERRIPWADLVAVHAWRRWLHRRGDTAVSVARLGLLHRLYGFYHTDDFRPAFLIHSSISGYADLVAEIERHVGERRGAH
jgi:lipid-A-disaccharide synthase-like uncharacterized protein